MKLETKELGDFLAARGGPFYELQRRLRLLDDNAFRAKSRAMIFVGLAWGVPLIFSLIDGNAFGAYEDNPYLLDFRSWARFFVAVGLFVLMEKQIEVRLHKHLQQFATAPLLASGSFEAAARVVTNAINRRDSRFAEVICLAISIFISVVFCLRLLDSETTFWAMQATQRGNVLTSAGWWLVAVSNPIFIFLLFRTLWRLLVWSMLLHDLSRLDLRLVATHPDGHGGLAFLGQYPNAYTLFVLGISTVVGAIIAHELLEKTLDMATYGYLMGSWLLIILALFSFPLLAFEKPLTDLKERTLMIYSSQATRYHRAAERKLVGENICAVEGASQTSVEKIPDPSKELAMVRKLSVFLLKREALLPISAAALLPLIAAGATQLPIKEIMQMVKRLLLF